MTGLLPKSLVVVTLVALTLLPAARAESWREVYFETFDRLPAGTRTASAELPNWEGGSAAGLVFDGRTTTAGKFLVASSAWTSFNQGPILNLELAAHPHDRVRVQFDLYTFGDWRGIQKKTGGPQHRLMFFDNKAAPAFSFDSNFSTHPEFAQSWPDRNPAERKALTGAIAVKVDATGEYPQAYRWPIKFEYASQSPALRFTMLCGAAAGSGLPMPRFAIDNVRVSVRSTAPTIELAERKQDVRLAARQESSGDAATIEFEAESDRRYSLGIFDRRSGQLVRTLLCGETFDDGKQFVEWDGLDNRGRSVAEGEYEWRSVSSNGLTARYITTIGINPPGGEHPVPSKSWVGDHIGAGIVDVDDSGIYIGSPMTEGGRMMLKCDPEMSQVIWSRPQFYQGGRLTRIAASGSHVFMAHPTGLLRRMNRDNGRIESEWQVGVDGVSPSDIDARGSQLVAVYPGKNLVRWLSSDDGSVLTEIELANPRTVAVVDGNADGAAFIGSGSRLFHVRPGQPTRELTNLSGNVVAMDYDPAREELWVVLDGHLVVRLDAEMNVSQTYGAEPRPDGPYAPELYAGIYDIAADARGGFFIGEPGHPPRRIARFARDGALLGQWFGGMSFYVSAAVDPSDPTRLFGIAPEGSVNVYRIDYDTGTWTVEACYRTGRLGDSLFPNSGSWRVIRKDGQAYLYHRVVPAVIRLDPKLRRAVPVAIAGRVINQGRTFFQFAGTGRGGYPKPWVAAAEHHGYTDLGRAPGLYSWADSNGNGEFEPEEFRFYPNAKRGLSFHNPGDFISNGDYIGSAKINEPHVLVRLPISHWEGPDRAAPRWDWDRLETAGEIIADSYGYGSPRGVSVAPDDFLTVAYQAGIMIRDHGQYEGGGWPEAALRGARVLGFDAKLQPVFSIGRQSKDAAEANTGVLYYPMQTAAGPSGSVVVNDQTKQPAQVWTRDGLYIGGVFDHRAEDGRDDRFYHLHGDDNQGATVMTAKNGRTYWLMPYQGHNRLYEVTGWKGWRRRSGIVRRPDMLPNSPSGTGLTARYYRGSTLALETVEAPIFYERFGPERHADRVNPHYKAVWSGHVTPPLSDRFRFHSLLGNAEQVAVWIDGRVVHAAGFTGQDVDMSTALEAGRRHLIRIEYINPGGRAELKLLWTSRVSDLGPIPMECMFPE